MLNFERLKKRFEQTIENEKQVEMCNLLQSLVQAHNNVAAFINKENINLHWASGIVHSTGFCKVNPDHTLTINPQRIATIQ